MWAPLANRLGVWTLKAQLEDLAFRQLYPAQYAELRERLERVQQPEVLVSLIDSLRAQLQRGDIRHVARVCVWVCGGGGGGGVCDRGG